MEKQSGRGKDRSGGGREDVCGHTWGNRGSTGSLNDPGERQVPRGIKWMNVREMSPFLKDFRDCGIMWPTCTLMVLECRFTWIRLLRWQENLRWMEYVCMWINKTVILELRPSENASASRTLNVVSFLAALWVSSTFYHHCVHPPKSQQSLYLQRYFWDGAETAIFLTWCTNLHNEWL